MERKKKKAGGEKESDVQQIALRPERSLVQLSSLVSEPPQKSEGMRLSTRRVLLSSSAFVLLFVVLLLLLFLLASQSHDYQCSSKSKSSSIRSSSGKRGEYDPPKETPLVFVGGVPRSGTTLMRAMLDSHPDVRCGQETRVVPRILALRHAWSRSGREKHRLDEAGVTEDVLDAAVASFLLQIIAKHGEFAPILCNKDPFALKFAIYLSKIFPNSKFVLMIRDGRATAHSMISRKVAVSGFDLQSYRDCLQKWSKAIESMHLQCSELGPERCMEVYYETLVLRPRRTMQSVTAFLGLKWSEDVLRHEEFVGKPGGVALSKTERSTEQVMKAVNVEALSKWVGHIPEDVLREMDRIAPMLSRLGYDPNANPPKYGEHEPIVHNHTHTVLSGDFKTPASLKGYIQVYQNTTGFH